MYNAIEVQFKIPTGEAENGVVRFQTQARDGGVDPIDQKKFFCITETIEAC